MPHGGIVNRLVWMQAVFGLGGRDVVLQKTPFTFDVSVWEFFWPLLAGARLVLARPGGHRDPGYLAGLIAARGVTTVHFVPSMLAAFMDVADPGLCAGLARVICGGEALTGGLRDRWAARSGGGCLTCTGRRRRRWIRRRGSARRSGRAGADRRADRQYPGVRA